MALRDDGMDIDRVIETGRARASKGAKLRTIRIVGGWNELDSGDELEFRECALHVEYSLDGDVVSDDSGGED